MCQHGKLYCDLCNIMITFTKQNPKQIKITNRIRTCSNVTNLLACRWFCQQFKGFFKEVHCNWYIIKCQSPNRKPCSLVCLSNFLCWWLVIAVILICLGRTWCRLWNGLISAAWIVLSSWWITWNRSWLGGVWSIRALIIRRIMRWGGWKAALSEARVRLEIRIRIRWGCFMRRTILWQLLLWFLWVGLRVVWLRITRIFRSVSRRWWMKIMGRIISTTVRGRWWNIWRQWWKTCRRRRWCNICRGGWWCNICRGRWWCNI